METILDLLGPALLVCPWCGGDGYVANEERERLRSGASVEAFAREHGGGEEVFPLCGGQGQVAAEWVGRLRLGRLVSQWMERV